MQPATMAAHRLFLPRSSVGGAGGIGAPPGAGGGASAPPNRDDIAAARAEREDRERNLRRSSVTFSLHTRKALGGTRQRNVPSSAQS